MYNNAYDFGNDTSKLNEFMKFLEGQINKIIYDGATGPEDIWQNKYILQSYTRGLDYATAKIKQALPAQQYQQLEAANIMFPQPALASTSIGLVPVAVSRPLHLDALQLIYSRDFSDLEGITTAMSTQISRQITTGMQEGKGINEIARLITDRVDKIGATRAKLMARTESIRAYNISGANEGKRVGDDIGKTPYYIWITTLDGRERDSHELRNLKRYTYEEYIALLGEPNCRCSYIIVFE